MGEEGEEESGLVPAAYVRMKPRDSVLLAFQKFPVENVVQFLAANASPEHTLLAAKELAYRAADPANCEDIYEAGGISALADLVLEDDLHIKVEALNGLINLAVDDQSRMDLNEAGVVMLAVALLQHPSPLVLFKACNLIINLTCLDEAKEKVREEEGIPALVATLRGSNERVRLMAVKALHNVLCGCVPYANHEALLATPNALVLLMKLVLTSQDGRVVTYLLKLLGLLLQYDGAVKAFCFGQKGPKMLLVLLKRNSEDKLMIASILQLLKVVAAQAGMEALNMVERVLAVWKEHRSDREVAIAAMRTLLTLTDNETNRQQFLSSGLGALVEALGSTVSEEQAAAAAIVARVVQDEMSAAQLLAANVLDALMQMLDMKSVKAVHHALAASAHLLGMAAEQSTALQPLHDSAATLLKFSLSRHKQIQLKALLLLEVAAQSDSGCQQLANANAIAVLFKVLPDWSERAQTSLLRIACAAMCNSECVQQVMKSGKLKYISTFLAGKQTEDPVQVELATLTHALLTKLKTRRAEQRASLGPGLSPLLGRRREESKPPVVKSPSPTLDESQLLDESRAAAAAALSPRQFSPTEVKVEVPIAAGQQTLIDKFAGLVAVKGSTVEEQALQKHSNNPRFAFLVQGAGKEWLYYLSKVSEALVARGEEEDSRFVDWKKAHVESEHQLFAEAAEKRVDEEVLQRKKSNEKLRAEYARALQAFHEKESEARARKEAEETATKEREHVEREKAEKERELLRMEKELERQERELREEEKILLEAALRQEEEAEEVRRREEEEAQRRRVELEEEEKRIEAEERAMAEELKRLEEERQREAERHREDEEREREREKEREMERERERLIVEEERTRAEKEQLEGLSELDAAMMELEGLMAEDSLSPDTTATTVDSLTGVENVLASPSTTEESVVKTESERLLADPVSSGDALTTAMLAFEAATDSLAVPESAEMAEFESLTGVTPTNATEEELREMRELQMAPSATELPCVSQSDIEDCESSTTAVEEFSVAATDFSTQEERETESESMSPDVVTLQTVIEEAEEVTDVGTLSSFSSLSSLGSSELLDVGLDLKPLASSVGGEDMLESAVVLLPPLTVASGVEPPKDSAPALPPSGSLPPVEDVIEVPPLPVRDTATEEGDNAVAPVSEVSEVEESAIPLPTVIDAPVVAPVSGSPAVEMPGTPGLHELSSSGQRVIVRCSWDDDVRTVRATKDMDMSELAAVVAAKYRKEASELLACTIKYREMEDFVLLESDDDLEMAFELCDSKLELRVASPATPSPAAAMAEVATPSAPPPPAPAPPPPPSDSGLKKRPAMAVGAAAAAAAAAQGGALASDRSSRPGRKPKGPKRMSLFEEMESKRTKLKKADRALSSMTIRRRKVAPKQADSSDMLSVMMQALDARRQHIATPDLDLPDDDEDWN